MLFFSGHKYPKTSLDRPKNVLSRTKYCPKDVLYVFRKRSKKSLEHITFLVILPDLGCFFGMSL